jgi:hypothetical protein
MSEFPNDLLDEKTTLVGKPTWYGWKLEHGTTLAYQCDGYSYRIELTGLGTAAKMLNTIMRVNAFDFATDQCMAGLVRALNDTLQPQTHWGPRTPFASPRNDQLPAKIIWKLVREARAALVVTHINTQRE